MTRTQLEWLIFAVASFFIWGMLFDLSDLSGSSYAPRDPWIALWMTLIVVGASLAVSGLIWMIIRMCREIME